MSDSLRKQVEDLQTERTETTQSFMQKLADASEMREKAEAEVQTLTKELEKERTNVPLTDLSNHHLPPTSSM